LQTEEKILSHATDYYKTLFGHAEKPHFSLDPDCLNIGGESIKRRK
jgi:hypothetical protein